MISRVGSLQTEEALRESEALLRVFIEHAPAAIAMFDTSMRYLVVSRRWLSDYGLGDRPIIGQSHYDVFPGVAEQWSAVHQRCLAGQVEQSEEDLVRYPDGRIQWLRWEVRPWRKSSGEVGGIVLFTEDITERKRADSEIRRLNQDLERRVAELQTLLEVLPIGIGIAEDAECRHIRVNPQFARQLGISTAENASLSAPDDERPTSFKVCRDGRELRPEELPMQYAIAHGEEVLDFECDIVHADGKVVKLLEAAAPLFDEQGRPRGCVGAFLDITERQRAEEALRRQAEELARADRAKDQFLAMLAHELRNPIGAISNAVQVVKRLGPAELRIVRAQEIIERQVAHTSRLLDDLLNVSRIARGSIRLNPVRLDLALLVRDTAEDSRADMESAGLTLMVELPDRPVWVEGDPTRLAQAVGNLLSNAVKFTDRGGQVSVRLDVEPGGEWAVLRVQDSGTGIAADDLPHIFETFAQADRTLDRSRGGLGLGLALVKGLVELHGGAVHAASEGIGRGAEFTLRLPLSAPPAMATELPPDPRVDAAARRVLIVEDNHDVADSLRAMLELCGCRVAVAYAGPAALTLAHELRPEFVLCDLGLPGMSGYEVAAALRHDPMTASARLIAVSGYGQEEDQQRALAAGFERHLTKPVNLTELERLLAVATATERG